MFDNIDNLIENAKFAVEANSFEKNRLWSEHKDKLDWKENTEGKMITLGELDGIPVCMSIFVDTLNGFNVIFYEMTSLVVDYRMVDAWLEDKFGGLFGKMDTCFDAKNFHNIINKL